MKKKLSIITSATALAVGAALVLTGCGSHAATASSPAKTSGSGQSQGQRSQGGFGGAGGGTVGEIAQVSGNTLQVQDSSSQTAVTYTSSTAITKTVSVALSAVTVGSCITATTTPASGSSSSSSSSAAVTSVAISQPTNGSCTAGFGGQGRVSGPQGGQGGTRPTDRPSNRPSGRPSGGFGGGDFVAPTSGKVTAVSGSTITVDALDFQTQKTSSKTVTVGSSTTYTQTKTGAASDLVVGQCVVARGKADDTGTVAATALTVSAPVNGSCTTGFGGGRGGFGGRGNGSGSQSGTTNG